LPAAKFVSGVGLFQAPLAIAIGKPAASTWKKLTRLNEGWWNPQQPKWLPSCGKFRRSPKFELAPFGSPSFTDA